MTFAEQLKAEQKRIGLTQAELAALLDVSPRVVWGWLNGKEPLALTREGALARLKAPSSRDVLTLLKNLPRYDVGAGFDGECAYEDVDSNADGRWVEWDDIAKIIKKLKDNAYDPRQVARDD